MGSTAGFRCLKRTHLTPGDDREEQHLPHVGDISEAPVDVRLQHVSHSLVDATNIIHLEERDVVQHAVVLHPLPHLCRETEGAQKAAMADRTEQTGSIAAAYRLR